MKNTPTLKIALIGGGINSSIGQAHFFSSKLDNRFQIVSGCFSKNLKTNLLTAKKWGIKPDRIYSKWQKLVNKEKKLVDAFVILVPTPNHYKILKKLISEKIAVICEKPLVSNLKEINNLKKELLKSKSFLAVTFNYTGYPLVREIKEIIKRNDLGKILNINIEMPQEVFLRDYPTRKKIQKWRLKDQSIPTICLDLGVHLYNLAKFVTNKDPIKVIGNYSNLAKNNKLVDDARMWIEYKDGMKGSFWLSKSSIGKRNGLRLQIFGMKASLEWQQTNPEELKINHKDGLVEILDRSKKGNIINLNRYNRYRAGHPSGFIEAFANIYYDIADAIIKFKKNKKSSQLYTFGIEDSYKGIKFLDIVNKSSKRKKWLKIY